MKEERSRRRRRLVLWGGGSLLVLLLLFVIVLPPVLRSQIEQRLAKALDRKVQVSAARFNPLRASLSIDGLRVEDKDGAELVGWGRLYVNINLLPLCWGRLHFDEIILSGLSGRVLVEKNGRLSVADLLPPAAASKAPGAEGKGGLDLIIDRLQLDGARLTFEDRSHDADFKTGIGPLSFSLEDFEIHPDSKAPYQFSAATEAGEKLTWKGTIGASPFRSSGELSLTGIQPARYKPYYAKAVNFDLLNGRVDLQGRYEVVLEETGPWLRLSEGRVAVSELAVAKLGSSEPVIALRELLCAGVELDSKLRQARVAELALKRPVVSAIRAANGDIDLLALAASAGDQASRPASGNASRELVEDWLRKSRVDRVKVEGLALSLRDETTPRPAKLLLEEGSLELGDLSLAPGAEMSAKAAVQLGAGSKLGGEGRLSLSPLRGQFDWTADKLPLAQFSPYLESSLRARLATGRLGGAGTLSLSLPEGAPVELRAAARLDVQQFSLVDEANGEPLAGWETLSLSGLEADLKERSLAIEELVLRAPSVAAMVDREGRLNLQGLLREPAAKPALAASEAPAPAQMPVLSITNISISEGRATYWDQSINPEVRFQVRDFGGQIRGIDSRGNRSASVALGGNLEGSGRVSLEGSLHPFGRQASTDLKLAVDSLNLVSFSPYSGKYAGYALSGGRLNVDIHGKLAERRLDSVNVLSLDNFSFGAASDSPEATKLPVRLAVALLKDREGRIVIDVPVQGSLDDPEFKVGKVVWRVIGNLLSKAATSPFSLLGAAFGGGEELSQVGFEPGGSVLAADAPAKLATLGKALLDRPGLSLTVIGNYDPELDQHAVRALKLDQLVARSVWQVRQASDPAAATLQEQPATEAECERALRALHAAKQGTGLAASGVVAAPDAGRGAGAKGGAAAPQAQRAGKDEGPGFFVRIYYYFTGRRAEAERRPAPRKVAEPKITVISGEPQTEAAAAVSMEEIIHDLEQDIPVAETDLLRIGLDRAQRVEQALREAGVDASRILVSAPAAGQARVELQLR